MNGMVQRVSADSIVAAARAHKSHFFDRGTMHSFGSTTAHTGFQVGDTAWLAMSNWLEHFGQPARREYFVVRVDMRLGYVDYAEKGKVGIAPLMKIYLTMREGQRAAERLATVAAQRAAAVSHG